jgi:transglutaminase/protease-like cytokinesis protein 3
MKGNKFRLVISGIISGCIKISIIIAMLVLSSLVFNSTSYSPSSFSENGLKQEYSTNEISSKSKNESDGFFEKKQYSEDKSSKDVIILYNGITIDEGIKSNANINNKAVQLTQKATSDRERAEILYDWIGINIKYDDNKAKKVLNSNNTGDIPESGAICAFENKSGICFDKACLYVSMSRAINLKVRFIGGQVFDGEKYTGHAWNQVYLNEENTWINIDTTFYDAGDYFDSNLFNEHKEEDIAGEW